MTTPDVAADKQRKRPETRRKRARLVCASALLYWPGEELRAAQSFSQGEHLVVCALTSANVFVRVVRAHDVQQAVGPPAAVGAAFFMHDLPAMSGSAAPTLARVL